MTTSSEEADRVDRAELQAILDHTRDLIVTLDADARIVRASASAAPYFGAPGTPFLAAVHDDDVEIARQALDAVQNHLRASFDCRLIADGDEVPIGWSATWVPAQRRLHVVGRDLSERLEVERRLRHAQRLESIARLAGGIAHDFNNLLAVIVGNVELLLERFADDPESAAEAALISQAADRGVQLVSRLVAYAQRQDLAASLTSVGELLANVRPRLVETLGTGVSLEVLVQPGTWPLNIDSLQLESVILDLASNAAGAMPDGGSFRVRADNIALGLDRRDFERLGVIGGAGERIPGDYVLLSFADAGVGMSPEVLASAFEPFFTTKAVGRGSGLGLAMVLGFVRQSGGMVGVRTRQRGTERGTTINLLLPRAAPVPEATPTPATAATPSSIAEPVSPLEVPRADAAPSANGPQRPRILVVDDDDLVRDQVASMLRRMGYEVQSARAASEALTLLERGERFDLLFTDVLMPGDMNGPELVLAARRIVPELRVLYTSGYTAELLAQRSRPEVEADRLLTKPYREQELHAKIEAALSR